MNELWAKLQQAVSTLISGGLYAMLEMIGGGASVAAASSSSSAVGSSSSVAVHTPVEES